MNIQDAADRRYNFAGGQLQAPYVLSQLTGSYQQIPDFLDSHHPIETKTDADAYIARLHAFARALDQETDFAEHDTGLGVVPPDFAIAAALKQMAGLRGTTIEKSVLVDSVAARERRISPGLTGQTPRRSSRARFIRR